MPQAASLQAKHEHALSAHLQKPKRKTASNINTNITLKLKMLVN